MTENIIGGFGYPRMGYIEIFFSRRIGLEIKNIKEKGKRASSFEKKKKTIFWVYWIFCLCEEMNNFNVNFHIRRLFLCKW